VGAQDERYDSSQGLIFCFEASYNDDILLTAEYEVTRTEIEQGLRCLLAPLCVHMTGGNPPIIAKGWSLSPTGRHTWRESLDSNTSHKIPENYDYGIGTAARKSIGQQAHHSHHNFSLTRSLFRCPVEGETCFAANESSSASGKAECTTGHDGNLCGQCMHGYTSSYNELCSPCSSDMEEVTVADWIPSIASILLSIMLFMGLMKCTSKSRAQTQHTLDRMRGRYALVKSAYVQVAKLQGMEAPGMDDLDGCVNLS
jgi:hypothetical protein